MVAIGIIWATAAVVVVYLRMVERWSQQVSAANEALKSSLRQLEELREALDQSAIVAATDQRGVITYANDKFCEISKYSRDELLGRTTASSTRNTIPRTSYARCGGRLPMDRCGAASSGIAPRMARSTGWTRRLFPSSTNAENRGSIFRSETTSRSASSRKQSCAMRRP